jgi:hypothetical protein
MATTARWRQTDPAGTARTAGTRVARVPVRPLEALRAGWGALCLLLPGPVIRVLGGAVDDEAARVVLRALGARHVLQAVGSGVAPGPSVLRVGALVDALHGLSDLVLAVLDPRRARVALVDAAIAAAWCLASLRDARRAPGSTWTRRERLAGAVLGALGSPVPLARRAVAVLR